MGTMRRSWTSANPCAADAALAHSDCAAFPGEAHASILTMAKESSPKTWQAQRGHLQQAVETVTQIEMFLDHMLQLCVLERENLDAELDAMRTQNGFNSILKPLVR